MKKGDVKKGTFPKVTPLSAACKGKKGAGKRDVP